jgi:hypothetical protein
MLIGWAVALAFAVVAFAVIAGTVYETRQARAMCKTLGSPTGSVDCGGPWDETVTKLP